MQITQAEWRSLLHQQQQKYQQSTTVYLKEIQERIRHVVIGHLRAHAAPGCFGAAPARHPAPGISILASPDHALVPFKNLEKQM